jgi:hypothetical protein
MDEKNREDWVDRQLREGTPYIDDDGFTARVLQKLPVMRSQRQSLRAVILIATTLLACALAYVLSDGGRFLALELVQLTALPTLWLLVLAVGSGILVMAGGLIAAISKTKEVQS